MSEANRPYEVRETERFGWLVELEVGDFARWDEIKGTLDLYVARNPLAFELVPGTDLRAIPLATNPPLTIFYSVDEEQGIVIYEGLRRV